MDDYRLQEARRNRARLLREQARRGVSPLKGVGHAAFGKRTRDRIKCSAVFHR